MTNNVNYSVLMSVYYKEKPDYLIQSIESMLNQTKVTNEFVIVCDGPLTKELDNVIEDYISRHPNLFKIIRLKENVGIGKAANIGLKKCTNNLVAKMDSDDISRLDRCEKQVNCFINDNDLAIVGGHISEFIGDVSDSFSVRKVPIEYNQILKYAKRRMPFNNQTVMYKKNAVLDVGGYSNLTRCEDYELYTRMLRNNYKAINLDNVLVDYRLNDDAIKRRGTILQLKSFTKVRWILYKNNFSNFIDFLIPVSAQIVITVVPNRLRKIIYKKLIRK